MLVAAAALWHALSVLTPAWWQVRTTPQARDFATYYYAAQVARDGGDPYELSQLNNAARKDQTRRGVHPFLYAPPFLLLVSWTGSFDLHGAYQLWFWFDELCLLGALLVLWRWWRELGDSLPVVLALLAAAMTAIPNNHTMGQANMPGLLCAVAGLWQVQRGRAAVGGALMGAACMFKMSPALFVFWWLARRQWVAAGAACAAAVVLSIAALLVMGPGPQARFYTEILPTFASGEYNGLAVSIDLFGNHSLPNVFAGFWPGLAGALSPTARWLSSWAGLTLVLGLCWVFRTPTSDPWRVGGQVGAISIAMLLLPVYTYEHHLVWALPAALIACVAVVEGALSARWGVVVGIASAVLAYDLQGLKRLSESMADTHPWLSFGVQELKFASLLALLVTTVVLGLRGRPNER